MSALIPDSIIQELKEREENEENEGSEYEDDPEFDIPIYDWDTFDYKKFAFILVIGESGSGKSVFFKWLCKLVYPHFIWGEFYCPTTDDPHLNAIFPQALWFHDFDEERVESLFENQGALAESRGNDWEQVPWLYIMTDDCGYDEGPMRSKAMKRIAMNARHDHIFCVVNVQNVTSVPNKVRDNAKMVVCLRDLNPDRQEALYSKFFGGLDWGVHKSKTEKLETFKRIFELTTRDYYFWILDKQNKKTNVVTEKIFRYRVDMSRLERPKRMCHRRFWELQEYYKKEANPYAYIDFLQPGHRAINQQNERQKQKKRKAKKSNPQEIADCASFI